MQILTERLRLRPVQPADRDALHRMEQDPEVMRYLNGGVPTPLVPADPQSSAYLMPRGAEPEVMAVIERDTGTLAGWIALFVEGEEAELGYRFYRSAWGQGYATEAAKAVISDAFARRDVTRIVALTMAVNTNSRRVMEKLGMRHAETCFPNFSEPIPGAEHGEVKYVLERKRRRS